MQDKYGPVLNVEQETIVRNMNLANNHDFNHGAIITIYGVNKQGAFAPKRTQGPVIFISKLTFL